MSTEAPLSLPGVLDRASLERWLRGSPPIVEGLLNPAEQLQPNGIDLTLRSVAWFGSLGQLGVNVAERQLPSTVELAFDPEGYLHLAPGPYLVTFNEIVHIPLGMTALAWPRSSLLRSGVVVHNAVGDAGYQGRFQGLMTVVNPHGFRVARDARVIQLVFFTLAQPVTEGYQGIYQQENLLREFNNPTPPG